MKRDHWVLALNGLRKRRLRSWLTMIGIFIGIAAIVSLISLGEGLRTAVRSQLSVLGADIISVQAGGINFVGPPGSAVANHLKLRDVERINNLQGIKFSIPRLLKTGQVQFNDRLSANIVASLPKGEYRHEIENLAGLKAEQGRLLEDGDRFKVVVAANFATIDIFNKPLVPGDFIVINGAKFVVVGVTKKVGSFFIDNAVFMNEETMRDLFDVKEEVSLVTIKVDDANKVYEVKDRIERLLRRTRGVKEGEEDFQVQVAASVLKSLDSTLFAIQLFVYIIASISLLVGGIGIMNTMYTAVLERTKEIGIMKAVGAKNKDIFYLFLIESGLLGLVGGLIGVLLGITLAKSLAAAGSAQLGSNLIQANASIFLVFGALIFSFGIGAISGITPAIRASRLHPVEALRGGA